MEQESVQSVSKALDILEIFLEGRREMALSEIAASLKMNKATARRLIATLVKRGYIYQKENRGKYSLGMIYLNFSGAIKSNMPFRNLAVPYLMRLSQEINESVILSLNESKNRVLTETFQDAADHVLKALPSESATVLLHSTCLGKIALSSFSDEELERYFNNRPIERRTPNTITNLNDMKYILKAVREEGVAYDDEEDSLGVRGVAAALHDGEDSIIGSIGVLAPTVRMTRNQMKKLGTILKTYAQQISTEFGFKG